jgi:hypothetical protein
MYLMAKGVYEGSSWKFWFTIKIFKWLLNKITKKKPSILGHHTIPLEIPIGPR